MILACGSRICSYRGEMVAPHPLFTAHKADAPWLWSNTILFAQVGSKAYGLDAPESDDDWAGVAFPPVDQVIGMSPLFEQKTIKDPDCTVFELKKFLTHALHGNPAFLDILFSDMRLTRIGPGAWDTPAHVYRWGTTLRDHCQKFLSQRMVPAYLGYAQSQLKRYTAQMAAQNPGAGKHAMHAIRALRTIREAHQIGTIHLRRTTDREELLAIRRGEISSAVTYAQACYEEALAKEAEKHSLLPKEPDTKWVNAYCMDALRYGVVTPPHDEEIS